MDYQWLGRGLGDWGLGIGDWGLGIKKARFSILSSKKID